MKCIAEQQRMISTLPKDRWHMVRYEDLCTNTDVELQRIFSFVDVDPKASLEAMKSREHHVVGNGMRLDSSDAVVLDDRWSTNLTREELQEFDDLAGETNRLLGYP